MTKYIIGIILALALLALGERLKNETKDVYVKKGYNWSKVILYSNLSAIISGIAMIAILHYTNIPDKFNPMFLPFAVVIVTYITVQSFMTDLKVLMINRNILRVAYMSMYAVTLYNIIFNDIFRENWVAVTLFTGLLVLIFIFSSIGASDVRAMAVAMPFVISIGGYDAILMFIATLLLVAIAMGMRNIIRDRGRMQKFKQDNMEAYKDMNKLVFYSLARNFIRKEKSPEELATPVGPYMIAPFLIFLFIYPFLIS